jgi:hypothetical protein
MNRVFSILAVLATALQAEEVPSAPKTEPYVLKHRSAYTLPSDTRAPFLPIGWTKSAARPVKTEPGKVIARSFDLQPEHFNLTSLSLAQPGQIALATINARSYAEGERLPVVFNNQNLNVVLRTIRDGSVTLEHDGKLLHVPLKRQGEIVPRAATPLEPLAKTPAIIIETQPKRR